MKILFTADWHLKLGQKNVPVDWAVNRYDEFFRQVHSLERDVDLHIIGGDLFDRLPSLEELSLYFQFVEGVSIPTVIFDGNHEATKKNKTFFSYLKSATKSINELVEIVDTTTEYDDFSILPYCDLHKKGSIEALNQDKPVFTHVRGEIPPHVKPEVDLDRFSTFPVVFAGDLHAHSNCQRNIVYPGSPMTISFHRKEVDTGYIIIDSSDWSWKWGAFELPQLLRKTVDNPDDMVATTYHHTIYELEGDMQDLADVENSDFLDKKIIRRSNETSLIIDKDMSIRDELVEYLTYVLEISDDKIPEIVGTFNDYTKNSEME